MTKEAKAFQASLRKSLIKAQRTAKDNAVFALKVAIGCIKDSQLDMAFEEISKASAFLGESCGYVNAITDHVGGDPPPVAKKEKRR